MKQNNAYHQTKRIGEVLKINFILMCNIQISTITVPLVDNCIAEIWIISSWYYKQVYSSYLLSFSTFVQVDTYEKIYSEADEIEQEQVFDAWFRVDSKPFKAALLNIIKKWSFMFKQHLIDHVTNRWAGHSFILTSILSFTLITSEFGVVKIKGSIRLF